MYIYLPTRSVALTESYIMPHRMVLQPPRERFSPNVELYNLFRQTSRWLASFSHLYPMTDISIFRYRSESFNINFDCDDILRIRISGGWN